MSLIPVSYVNALLDENYNINAKSYNINGSPCLYKYGGSLTNSDGQRVTHECFGILKIYASVGFLENSIQHPIAKDLIKEGYTFSVSYSPKETKTTTDFTAVLRKNGDVDYLTISNDIILEKFKIFVLNKFTTTVNTITPEMNLTSEYKQKINDKLNNWRDFTLVTDEDVFKVKKFVLDFNGWSTTYGFKPADISITATDFNCGHTIVVNKTINTIQKNDRFHFLKFDYLLRKGEYREKDNWF